MPSLRKKGFSLIDVIVGIALMLVLFLALFGILRASLVLSTLVKAKAAAIEIATSQMEYLRGISYDTVGTVGGIPAGSVPQSTTVTVDGIPYTVRTFIIYKDDPADGLGASDTNGITTDYKLGKVEVSYSLYGITKSVAVMSNFIPQGIEASTGGGTLSIHTVTATNANLSDATVRIVNSALSPTVDFTTFSDVNGLVLIGGAMPSAQYQIYVSKTGYSSAQTYANASPNVNPTPGYLTVAMNHTTSATFAIDHLASLTLASWSPATTTAFSDTFANASNLASQTGTQVSGGAVTLVGGAFNNVFSGVARSIPISPSALDGWGILSANMTTPANTSVVVKVDDTAGTPLPDTALPGNSTGFSSFPVSLAGIATSTYPGLSLEADLSRVATSSTVSLLDWSLTHTEGPSPQNNVAFTLTGAKTIGSTATHAPIYKTIVSDTTGATGVKTESLEWDAYTLALSSRLFESCQPQAPYQLAPAEATTTALLVGTLTAGMLPIDVNNADGSPAIHAKVVLAKNGYAATIPASACGIAYFINIPAGTYSATASLAGHTKVFVGIVVAGLTATTTVTLP